MRTPIIIALLVLGLRPVYGQENVVLPDLAPRVVEITGDLTISFPSLDRQPLVGFNPPPRVPEIPSTRSPHAESYKQSKEDLPQSVLQAPEAPEMSTILQRTPATGIVDVGVGRYLERFVRAHLSAPVGASTTFYLAGQYRASDGHEPFEDKPDVDTATKTEFLSVGLRNKGASVHYGVGAGIERFTYSLFGAVPVAVSPALTDPSRYVRGMHANAWLSTSPGSRVGAHVGIFAGLNRVETNLYNPMVEDDPDIERDEDHLIVEGGIGIPISTARFSIDGHVAFQGLDTDGFPGRTIPSGSAAGKVHMTLSDDASLSAGLRVLGFEALGQATGGANRKLVFVSPDFQLEYTLSPGVVLTVANTPEVSRHSMLDMYYLSPYIEDRPLVQPELTSIDFRAGLRFLNEVFSANAGVGWRNVENYRFIENSPVPVNGFGDGFLTVNYEEASIFFIDAQLGAVVAPGIQANLEVAYRKGRLDVSDTIIPYFSPVTTTASILANMFGDRFKLKVAGRGESPRFADRAETSEVSSIFQIDIEGTWFLTPYAGLIAGIRDLGGKAEFWENYEREASVFFVGASWRW